MCYFAPDFGEKPQNFQDSKIIINVLKIKIMSEIESKVGADSLDTVELIMEFEKEFGISIPDDKAEKIGTVGDAIAYIEENAK